MSGPKLHYKFYLCSEHLATLGDCMEMSFAPTDDNLKLEEFYEEAAESLADKLEEVDSYIAAKLS